MTPEEFINWLGPTAQQICRPYRLFASVCIAQGALESGWGEYIVGRYNLFGRKWGGWGNYLETETTEYIDGEWITVNAKFQDYASLAEAVKDWCVLLTEEPAYQPCLNFLHDRAAFIRALAPVYATDPTYADKILSTIRANDLAVYDE